MNKSFFIISFIFLFSLFGCGQSIEEKNIEFGNEVFLKSHLNLIEGKRIGIIANQTSVLPNGTHLVDTLLRLGFNVTAIFAPEHDFRGDLPAGKNVAERIDEKTGVPIYSLYGKNKKPTAKHLANVDILIYDLQDIGARFYTYISTLYYSIEAAAESNKTILILDRPNPLNGNYVSGEVLKREFISFIGIARLTVAHGFTIGEIAKYFSGEELKTKNEPDIKIIKMNDWEREKYWDDFNLKWIPTSPNIPDFETALIYPAICFLEGTNISEGRGTGNPFKIIGAPFINSADLVKELKKKNIPGIKILPQTFTPVSIAGKAVHPKFENEECSGIKISVTDKTKFKPVEFGVYLLTALVKLYPDKIIFKKDYFDKLAGSDKLRKELLTGIPEEEIINGWEVEIENFKSIRKKYLLY